MMRNLKTNSSRKMLLSLLIGVLMNPIWLVITLIIIISTPIEESLRPEPIPMGYVYDWASGLLSGPPAGSNAEMLLIFLSNAILYFTLSYILLSLFGNGKINGKKIAALLIGVLMNPILVAILFKIDEHITNKIMLSISLVDRTLPAYMFNWSSVVFTGQRRNVPAEMLVAHISNTILYFALSYGLLSLIGKISIASGSESDSRLKNTKQKSMF